MIQKTHITVAAILLSVRHVDAFSFPASVVTAEHTFTKIFCKRTIFELYVEKADIVPLDIRKSD